MLDYRGRVMSTEPLEATPALGAIVEQGRGALPFALVHGEALVACAAWALGDAGITAVDLGTPWAHVVDAGEAFVLHDPLCPMTPASFIADCLARSLSSGSVVVGVDRDGTVLSPVVLAPEVVAALDETPVPDFDDLVRSLEARFPVQRVLAPDAAARVRELDDIAALEVLTTPKAP